jgi:polysaccharide export outer membrane protein
MIQACYSSTAVKGTPVRDLLRVKDERVLRRKTTKVEKEKIAGMSRVTQNKTFATISGIPEYRIGPLDVLEIHSHKGDQVSTTTITVNDRGRISYSFIDDLQANGLTPSQLDALLCKKLSNFIRNPRIHILVKEFNSKYAMIIGEVTSLRTSNSSGTPTSGRIYLKGKTSLMDLIVQAGGYTENADIKDVRVTKGGETFHVNLFDIIERGDKTQNLIIDEGDTVDVPDLPIFGERVYVLGEVARQGVYRLDNAQDLLAAISLAGSFTSLAKEEYTLIVRGYEPGDKPLVMMANLDDLLRKADLSQNIPLRDGDLVYVPRMFIGDINDWIANTMPLLDFLFYPKDFQDEYFLRNYLHLDRHHNK